MNYEFRLALVDDVSKEGKSINKTMDNIFDITRKTQAGFDKLPPSMNRLGRSTDNTRKKTRGLLREITSMNRMLRRTTMLFGAAFGLSEISRFTNEIIDTEQNIANMFGLTGQALKDTASQATRLATVYRVDVNEGIESANTLAKQFGLNASDSLSLIEKAMSRGVSKEFLADIEELSPSFRQAGLSAENLVTMLAQGQRAGVGSELAKGYAEAIERLGSMSGEGTNKALEAIGFSPRELKRAMSTGETTINDVISKVTAKIQSMGADSVQAKEALQGIFGESSQAIQNNLNLLAQVPGSLSSIQDRTTEATKSQRYLFQAWADFKVFIAENVVPVLVNVVQWVKANQQSLLYWGSIALKVGGAITGIWLAAKSFMMIRGMVNTISAAFAAFRGTLIGAKLAQIALNLAMRANPIGILLTIIGAVIAGIAKMTGYWENFKNFLYKVGQFLWKYNPISWMIYAIDKVFPGFKAALKKIWDWTAGVIIKGFMTFYHIAIKPIIDGIWWILEKLGLVSSEAKKMKEDMAVDENMTLTTDYNPNQGIFGKARERAQMRKMALGGGMGVGSNLGVSAGIAGVQSDGAKARNVTINIENLIRALNFNTTHLSESTGKIKEEVTKALLSAVNDANAAID